MNIIYKCSILVFLLSFSVFASANKSSEKLYIKASNTISLKCHVELVGGKNTILYHYNIPQSNRASFKDNLIKGNMHKTLDKPIKIYKVHECIEISHSFKDTMTNLLDKKMKNQG